jgi:hypothetical protein
MRGEGQVGGDCLETISRLGAIFQTCERHEDGEQSRTDRNLQTRLKRIKGGLKWKDRKF